MSLILQKVEDPHCLLCPQSKRWGQIQAVDSNRAVLGVTGKAWMFSCQYLKFVHMEETVSGRSGLASGWNLLQKLTAQAGTKL